MGDGVALMRLGTRGSALALAQARWVAGLLGGAEIVTITTTGDRASAAPLDTSVVDEPAVPADKSRWVLELEAALHSGEIDLAVHSAKDVPGELGEGLQLLGAPARADIEDVLCVAGSGSGTSTGTGTGSLDELPPGARVGTGSVRRMAQLRAARNDLSVVGLGGNVDTRLRRLSEGAYDALVLARAGLQRLGREDEAATVLDPTRFVPSPGQGTLALEGRADDDAVRLAVEAVTDHDTFACLRAERALASALGASCHTPLGVWARPAGCGCLELRAWVGLPDGSAWVSDEMAGGFYDPQELGRRAAERMVLAGAGELLRRAEEMALERV
jgi:hydroxymethylbilane synthase